VDNPDRLALMQQQMQSFTASRCCNPPWHLLRASLLGHTVSASAYQVDAETAKMSSSRAREAAWLHRMSAAHQERRLCQRWHDITVLKESQQRLAEASSCPRQRDRADYRAASLKHPESSSSISPRNTRSRRTAASRQPRPSPSFSPISATSCAPRSSRDRLRRGDGARAVRPARHAI